MVAAVEVEVVAATTMSSKSVHTDAGEAAVVAVLQAGGSVLAQPAVCAPGPELSGLKALEMT